MVKVGIGKPQKNWSFEEKTVAYFESRSDAEHFIKSKVEYAIFNRDIYYMEMENTRYFYSHSHEEKCFYSADDLIKKIGRLYIPGYELHITYTYDEGHILEYDFETRHFLSYKDAEQAAKEEKEYYGAETEIYDEQFDVYEYFWTQDFIEKYSRREKTLKDSSLNSDQIKLKYKVDVWKDGNYYQVILEAFNKKDAEEQVKKLLGDSKEQAFFNISEVETKPKEKEHRNMFLFSSRKCERSTYE